jgi:uncharacterized RDD family membrane protein YckC
MELGYSNESEIPPRTLSMSELSLNTSSASLFVRRWLGTYIDLFVTVSFFGLPIYLDSELPDQAWVSPIFMLVAIAMTVLYYIILEGFTGYTLGKLVTRVRVVNENGQRIGLGKALLRTLLRVVEVNPFFFGGIIAGISVLVTQKKQRLGDISANTYVLKVNDLHSLGILTPRGVPLLFTTIFLVAATFFTFGLYTLIQSEGQTHTYVSQNRFQVTAPSGWSENGDLNSDADISIESLFLEKYVIVFSESKDDFDSEFTFEDYRAFNEEQELDLLGKVTSEFKKLQINGYDAYQCFLQGTPEGTEVTFIYTLLETPTHYHKIIAWTLSDKYDRYKEELMEVVHSFREIEE